MIHNKPELVAKHTQAKLIILPKNIIILLGIDDCILSNAQFK